MIDKLPSYLDWTEWSGGDIPVGEETMVEFVTRDGRGTAPAGKVRWSHTGEGDDITQFRVVGGDRNRIEAGEVDPAFSEMLNRLVRGLDNMLNPTGKRNIGFGILMFNTNEPPQAGKINWISNCVREDMALALKEVGLQLSRPKPGQGN